MTSNIDQQQTEQYHSLKICYLSKRLFQEKFSPLKLPGKIALLENPPPPPENCPTRNFLREFFFVSDFYFYRLILWKSSVSKSIFIQNNLFILFCKYIFDFQICHITCIIHRWVTNNAGQRYLDNEGNYKEASLKLWGSYSTSTRKYKKYSRQIFIQFTPQEKALSKFTTEGKMLSEKHPRVIPAPRELHPRNKSTLQEM